MIKRILLLAALPALLAVACSSPSLNDLTIYVDPFIGTAAHGHTFPGATTPFGMVQLSPDNGTSGWDWCSGYHWSDTVIAGFSHTHLSGTGIGDLCDILFLPSMHEFTLDLPDSTASLAKINRSLFSHEAEQARPGYYAVALANGVNAELTVTPRCGIQRYTAADDGIMHVLVDLGFAINWDRPAACSLQWDGTALSGMRISQGWAERQYQYFYSLFSRSPASITMLDAGHPAGDTAVSGKNIAALLAFEVKQGDELLVRTGISAVDEAGAAGNLEAETEGWDFNAAAAAAGQAWQKRLSVIRAESSDSSVMKVFYTALYHSMIAPSLWCDTDDRYRGTDGEVHTAEGFTNYTVFSLWDTYRAAHPLFTITAPDMVPDFINTMLTIREQQGKLPVWSLAGNETNCMIGYHAVPVLTDAVHKKLPGFDYERALDAALHSASLDFRGLDHYRSYGFIPSELENESVAKTMEYAIDDWCISQMAADLGHPDIAGEFLLRSKNYRNLFDTTILFVRGRMSDGSWRPGYDPLYSHHTRSDFTEGNGWQYTWLVPHDVEGLISLFGSRELFLERLDSLFNVNEEVRGENASPDISGLIGQYAHGNEPSHHISYLFSMAGDPERTETTVRRIMKEMYTDGRDGLCGNEDCGQMSAWYLFSAMGFYPVNPADGRFVIGSPLLARAEISLPGGKIFTVSAENNSALKINVSEIFLNGERLDRNYITYEEIMTGGELKFIMK
ncbi:MAG: GH92 family glycosyl hydrolase [Bacteroidales bacterium]|nr:GH92 family glycosyl hydrolase [Bacteroidales bacterium]MDT8372903.1 GH92 family glycosyl hydrolase [Bacteroidales bacterium]